MRYGGIIPLIGGNVLGAQKATGKLPEVMLSWKAFAKNDANIRAHWPSVPFEVLDDKPDLSAYRGLDFFTALCPCAGLSTAAGGSTPERRAANNSWLYKSTELVLNELQPRVLFGENAPTFFTERGKLVREDLGQIAKDAGYSFSCYATNTLLHGVPQSRKRTFYFAWKDSAAPVLNSYQREYPSLETYLAEVQNTPEELAEAASRFNRSLEVRYLTARGGLQQARDFMKTKKDPTKLNLLDYIRDTGRLGDCTAFAVETGTERQAANALRRQLKIDTGKSIFNDCLSIFNGVMPTVYWRTQFGVHPVEDRCFTVRESMHLMAMPADFQLVSKDANAICQSVPVCTAADMTTEVIAFLNGERKSSGKQYYLQSNLL